MTGRRARGPFLTIMAVSFALLALSNATKAWQHVRDPKTLGIVILGVRFEDFAANALLGPLLGIVLAAYAYGLWTLQRWVVPLSIAYALLVVVGLW